MSAIEMQLITEHQRLSAFFTAYNEPGTHAPGISEQYRKRLIEIEDAMVRLRDRTSQDKGEPTNG